MITLEQALATGRGLERPFSCPNTEAHKNGDATASASVNVAKGWWTCYACGAKGTLEGYLPDPKESLRALEEAQTPPRLYPEAWLDLFDAHHSSSYWSGRFGEEVAARYRCGTHPQTGNPTYPMRSATGAIFGVVQRTDAVPKYRYPNGARSSQTLFWSIARRRADVLVLVEGAADVMALDQAGLPERWRVAGCYGAGLHAAQLELVVNTAPKVIIAAFDGDEAGQNASARTTSLLGETTVTLSHRWDTFGAKDPALLSIDQRIPALISTLAENGYEKYGDNA